MGEHPKGQFGGRCRSDLFRRALVRPDGVRDVGREAADIKYASIYDSFTITVLMQIEDLGFCEKGQGGRFVADGNLISGQASCRSTRMAAGCATTTRPIAAASPR